jgi:hypothetical protein
VNWKEWKTDRGQEGEKEKGLGKRKGNGQEEEEEKESGRRERKDNGKTGFDREETPGKPGL